MIDRDIHRARALLVEGNAMLRSVAADQLRSAGVGHVAVVSRPRDARLLIEREAFDIIVCSLEFESAADSGQDLLDELRREGQLSHGTVFLMISTQASYAQVMEAGEAALDGLLVRPYTAAALAERLAEARRRRRELAPLLEALDAGEHERALALALRRYQARAPYGDWCGRVAAELLLGMQRPADAARLFETLDRPQRVWARLGIARAQMATGDARAAGDTLAAVLEADPDCADAHDLRGRLLVEQTRFDEALDAYRTAARLTPGCLLRAQHAGALAFYQGHADEALGTLERAVGLGVQSKLFDALTLVLIALLRHDRGDVHGLASMGAQVRRYAESHPESLRLRRFAQAAEALGALARHACPAALRVLRAMAADVTTPRFDLEAANLLLMLWARVPAAHRPPAEHEALIEQLAMRFCTSKAMGEVLLASARRCEPAASAIRRCQARLAEHAEQAMDLAMRGQPAEAVEQLLASGEAHLNARHLELAQVLCRRHAGALPDPGAIEARVTDALARLGPPATHIAGIQRSGRAPAAMLLRGRTRDAADAAA